MEEIRCMIRIKFLYSTEDYVHTYDEKIICEYDRNSFIRIVNGFPSERDKKPPFRDEDSMRFIREIDRAEFVENDWYSVVTPFNRTCMTALCGGTQYALTVIHNSRRGIYTSVENYNEDIWGRLANLSIDVLVYVKVYKMCDYFASLDIPYSSNISIMIENYRYEGKEMEAYISKDVGYKGRIIKDGKLYVADCFEDFCFSWHRNFDQLIKEAESLLKAQRYKHSPIVSNIKDFVSTLNLDNARDFFESMYIDDKWLEFLKDWLEPIEFHNYMEYIPDESLNKYPMYFAMKKNKNTQECVAKQCFGVKYPTFSEAMMSDFMWLPEEETADYELLIIVLDSELFLNGADEMKSALWAFKNYDNVMEMYDGDGIYDIFLDFIKQPFENGLVTFDLEDE